MPYEPPIPSARRTVMPVRFSHASVLAGGVALAMLAGYINVVMLGFFHVPVSHMTGAVSRIGIDATEGRWLDLWQITAIFASFLGGATLCGVMIGRTRLRPGRRYGVVLIVEAGMLALAAMALRAEQAVLGMAFAAMACGLQNAMASSYYGLVLRTTHVTGIVTDMGVLIGHWLRGRRIEPWKIGLLASLLVGFGAGSVLGAVAAGWLDERALWCAAACCAIGGLSYLTWHQRSRAARRRRMRLALAARREKGKTYATAQHFISSDRGVI